MRLYSKAASRSLKVLNWMDRIAADIEKESSSLGNV
jgi:hypothetical protein